MTTTKARTSSQITNDADFDAVSHKIINLAAPSVGGDAVNKTYADGLIAAANAMVYKGAMDCSATPNYPAADAGDTYLVSVGGKIGGASGTTVVAGDLFICTVDSTASGTQAGVGANWDVVHVVGFQTIPVKATGAEVDTGTEDTKFVTAKAINDSHNVPNAVPGTSGNVLASNGTDWISSSAAAVPVKATATELDAGTDDAKFATALGIKNAHNIPNVVPSTSGKVMTSDGTDWISSTPTTYPAETATTIGALINAAAAATPNDTDLVATAEAAGLLKKITWTAVKAFLKTYNDTLYDVKVTWVTREAVAGTKNGSNATFTLAHSPTVGSEMLFLNGMLLNSGAGNDYTISGLTITMLTGMIPVSTDVFLATYRY